MQMSRSPFMASLTPLFTSLWNKSNATTRDRRIKRRTVIQQRFPFRWTLVGRPWLACSWSAAPWCRLILATCTTPVIWRRICPRERRSGGWTTSPPSSAPFSAAAAETVPPRAIRWRSLVTCSRKDSPRSSNSSSSDRTPSLEAKTE